MGDAPRIERSSIAQMRQCLFALTSVSACVHLHRSKAIYRKSEADILDKQLRDAADFLAALEPHKDEIRAMLARGAA